MDQQRTRVGVLHPGFKAVGVFGFSYLEENADKVQGLSMTGVEPTYANISDFSYPGARPLYIYVKKSHFSLPISLDAFLQQWVGSWGVDGPLASIGMVASPADTMAENERRVNEQITMTRADLTGETAE